MSDTVEQSEHKLSVSVVTDAPIPALFDFLTVPANHVLIDGSGALLAAEGAPVRAVGDTFTMQMSDRDGQHYTVENHVVEYMQDLQLAWRPTKPATPPVGVRWDWQFDVGPKGETVVTQTCDWSQVTDAGYLEHNRLPRVTSDEMRQTIRRLIDQVSSYS
ncbi:hypothetical protein [Cumulibacter soli]|uniref:hypothetical protein n=1 Tax=Cumulibacter soli TaxID=2546344 RepID=UPI00106822E9|nr:hypothetical protein [Cumulibacter soli]